MTDSIGHECGLGMIRLRKPLSWYQQKYGSPLWGLNRMYLLMEKMHNRGQDGAGLAVIKSQVEAGNPYIHRIRNNQPNPWISLNKEIQKEFTDCCARFPDKIQDAEFLNHHFPWLGEIMMAHLRYGTHGGNSLEYCHPFIRHSNWRSKTLVMAGNFNLTNVDELFDRLIKMGQHPRYLADTITVMEKVGHFLEDENDRILKELKPQGSPTREVYDQIESQIDLVRILQRASARWDGGYAMGGLIGTGDGFVARDPNGIRPAFYTIHEDYIAVASERPALATVFNIPIDSIEELLPGNMIWLKANGEVRIQEFTTPAEKPSKCSFERIYFSRGSDPDIYAERKALGYQVVPKILKAIQHDLPNTVFSYVPNTSETAFLGMMKGLEDFLTQWKIDQIQQAVKPLTTEALQRILEVRPRVEKVIIKDVKLRTFIADDANRNEMAAHVYDVTYGVLREGLDTIVCIDDSIVRGTTIRQSILAMLARLKPKKIVMVSSAPQIRYPDCYGIDMSQIGRFVAFEAAISLIKERGMHALLDQVYQECLSRQEAGTLKERNVVKDIYQPFTAEEISARISQLLTPLDLPCEFEVVFPNLEDLHLAIPNHTGDWYFSGNYPTPGGNKVVNQAFMNYMTGNQNRAY
jgi:amidophosphoribosyltransferase